LQRRITVLEGELKSLAKKRSVQSAQRLRSRLHNVSIAGYTNAGKSTLLNALTDAGVLVEDRLFATLDSTVRRLVLPNHRSALVADTVGFVRRLPHHLVEAFQSTLAEVAESDLLLLVVDGTDNDPAGQLAAVREVLLEIDAGGIPELVVVNKVDSMSEIARRRLQNLYPGAVLISALKGVGLEEMLGRVADLVEQPMVTLTLEIPYDRGDLVAAAHRVGDVVEEKHDDQGTILEVRIPESARGQFAAFSR
jgi:GTP-binding protein HflX